MLVHEEKTPSAYLNIQILAAEQEKQTLISHHINLFPGNVKGTGQTQGMVKQSSTANLSLERKWAIIHQKAIHLKKKHLNKWTS